MSRQSLTTKTAFAFVTLLLVTPAADAAELVQAPADSVFYELSNLRVEKGVTSDLIAFDYKRTREGKGTPQLVGRTDESTVQITSMFSRIEATGTMRLEDRFSRIRSVLNRGQGELGIEFYFVTGSQFGITRDKVFLVSNAIRHGSMSTTISARPASAAEVAAHQGKAENIPLAKIAIDQRTLADQKVETAKESFAANIANYSAPFANSSSFPEPAPFPGQPASMASSAAFPQEPETTPDDNSAVNRFWSDQSGKFNVHAKLTKRTDSDVFLQREDGKVIQVPIAKLSSADREYLDQAPNANADPFGNVVSANSATGQGAKYSSPLQLVSGVGNLTWGAKSVAISPDNKLLMIGRKAACASLCDLKTGRILIDSGRMDHMGDVSVCGFTPDSKLVVIGGDKGVIDVFEISAKGQLKTKSQFASHTKEVISLTFSADGKFALTGSEDKEARYWEVETGRQLAVLSGFAGKVKATCISPSGKLLMATDGQTLQVYDVEQSKVIKTNTVGRSWAGGQAAAFSPNGLLLAVGDSYDIHLLNLQTETELPTMKGSEIAWSMRFAPDNQHLLSGGNGVINIWDAKTQSRVLSQSVTESYYIQALCASADGSLVAAPSGHNSVSVFGTAP